MDLKLQWVTITITIITQLSGHNALRNCPPQCACHATTGGTTGYRTACLQGDFIVYYLLTLCPRVLCLPLINAHFNAHHNNAQKTIAGGFNAVPIHLLDTNVTELIIRGPNNHIAIGQIFNSLKYLRTLRITESNVQAIGLNSFWGVQSLLIIGMCDVYRS